LLHYRVLEQCAYLVLRLASLKRRRLREPSEQSRYCGYVLTCPSKAWEAVIVLDDSSMRATGPSVHLVMVLGDLMLERHALLLQMESRGFELPLSLPQLAHMRVGWDLRVHRSPVPISRMWGSPISPMSRRHSHCVPRGLPLGEGHQ
jgi:hypothetical protein